MLCFSQWGSGQQIQEPGRGEAAHAFPCTQSVPVRDQVCGLSKTHKALGQAGATRVASSCSLEGGVH